MGTVTRRTLLAATAATAGVAGCLDLSKEGPEVPPVAVDNFADVEVTVDVTVRDLSSEQVDLDRTVTLFSGERRDFVGIGTGDHRIRVAAFGNEATETFTVREGENTQFTVGVEQDEIVFGRTIV